jgi:hypothetical protein
LLAGELMARNMIAANITVFRLLDDYAASRSMSLESAGQVRWIATESADRVVLKEFDLSRVFKISPVRALARFDRFPDSLFVLIGFDDGVESRWLTPVDVGAGLLTAVIAEVRPQPTVSPLQVKQIVDAEDKRTPGYAGHGADGIATLFPSLKAFCGYNLSKDEDDRIIYDFVLSETGLSSNWVDDALCKALGQLTELNLHGIPYLTVARSMLDCDRASLFLALYRCLESLYAHAGANRVRSRFGLTQSWSEVAVALEAELGWRPTEWQSLESLMAMGAKQDLEAIRDSISPAFPGNPPAELVRAASDYLYKLRNSAVHFRPAHSIVNHGVVDWGRLCQACATLIAYVYSEIFGSL